jgi:deoxyribodipyrimidine photo-lyase
MIQEERIKFLNRKKVRKGAYVLYWMQASQRAEYNHALEYAILKANELRQPLLVFFGITDHFPEANERHYTFMLEGLKEVQQSLSEKGIRMILRHKSPEKGAVELAKRASLAVVDRGYLKVQRQWRAYTARHIDCPFIQVESDVIVPVEAASPQEEYTAATLRPKIHKQLDRFLVPLRQNNPVVPSLPLDLDSFDARDVPQVVSRFPIDHRVRRVRSFSGGMKEAQKRLRDFLEHKLDRFGNLRNDPTVDYVSHLSPYLHFGQISPLYIALKALETRSPGKEAFLEELVVRRELSMNFVYYNEKYDAWEALPAWAQKTLNAHRKDRRPYLYSLPDLEGAKTHDPYWNAAQEEMVLTGKMHGYMRMYWGKKILEWTASPGEAFRIALYLNNKYELDGRDPNGFAGVAWCFGKHDRPWAGRAIFGNIRYMNDKGLRRKFAADDYVKMVNQKSELERKKPLFLKYLERKRAP